MTSASLVAIVEEEMSMSIVPVVVDTHAIVVVARDDVENLAGHRLGVKIKARRKSAGTRCWGR